MTRLIIAASSGRNQLLTAETVYILAKSAETDK